MQKRARIEFLAILLSLPSLIDLLLGVVTEMNYTLVLMVIKRLGRALRSFGLSDFYRLPTVSRM